MLDATAAVAKRHPALTIEQYGDASSTKAFADKDAEEQGRSMMTTLGSTLVILFIVFGALVAASVPLLLAVTAVFGTGGLVAIASQLMPMDDVAQAAILLIGLAVGVDYSLFYIRRMREERAKGHEKLDAIDIAAATSGRAVLLSGLTVMAAMAGMLLTDNATFMSMGVSTILVVAVAVIGSLTVLPAVIAGLGDKLDKGRIPFLGRRQAQARESRLWGALTTRVMRHPKTAAVISAGLLVALALPATGMQTKLPGIESEASSQPIIQTYLKIQKAFPSEANYAMVVVEAKNIDAPKVQDAIAKLNPAGVEINPKHTVATVNVGLPGSGVERSRDEGHGAPAREHRPGRVRQARRRHRGRHRRGRGDRRLQRHDEVQDPDRVRLRARALVPADALLVPLDRDPDQGDHPQPAVGRRLLRPAEAGLPGRPRREAARLRVQRRRHELAPAVPVRDPLRPLAWTTTCSSSAASRRPTTAA